MSSIPLAVAIFGARKKELGSDSKPPLVRGPPFLAHHEVEAKTCVGELLEEPGRLGRPGVRLVSNTSATTSCPTGKDQGMK